MDCPTDILYRVVLSNNLLCQPIFTRENMLNIFIAISANWTKFILSVLLFEIYFDIKHPGTHLEYHTSKLRSRSKRYDAGLSNTNSR